jgi:hypothetical protein
MPKPYSQDLRNRVIDAVERGEMSRRARRYEIRIRSEANSATPSTLGGSNEREGHSPSTSDGSFFPAAPLKSAGAVVLMMSPKLANTVITMSERVLSRCDGGSARCRASRAPAPLSTYAAVHNTFNVQRHLYGPCIREGFAGAPSNQEFDRSHRIATRTGVCESSKRLP